MENQIIKNKRSLYVWIILVLLILGILGSFGYLLSGLINIKTLLTTSFLSNSYSNITRLGLYFIDLLISIIYFSKLYNLKKNVVRWTHITFAYFIFQGFLSVILTPGLLFALLMFIPWFIVTIITIIIWITFVKHLKKIQKINNIDVSTSVDIPIINPEISKDENVDNKKEEKKSLGLLLWIKDNKKLVIILLVIIFIVIIIPVSMFFGVKIMSKVKCGDGGYLNGDLNNGYNCLYYETENKESMFVDDYNNLGVEIIQAQLIDGGDMQFVEPAGLYEGTLTFQNLNNLEQHTYFVCLEDLSDFKINGIYDLPSNYYLPHGEIGGSMQTNGCNRELKLHDGVLKGEGKIANEVGSNSINKENMFVVPSWTIYQSKNDGFSALFPGEPVFNHEELDYFPYNYNSYIVKTEDYIYAVDIIKNSPIKSKEADSAIIEFLQLFKEEKDISDEEISIGSFLDFGNYRALTVTVGDGREDFIGRVIYTKDFIVFYGVSKKHNNTLFNQDDAKKFLNSLNLWD